MKSDSYTNPFVLQPYLIKELFCDRDKEMKDIITYLENGANISLITMKRIGKTGLILRTFEELRSKKYGYTAIYAEFITGLFKKSGKRIGDDIVSFILNWSCCHTFYTQYLCNTVYMISCSEVTMDDVYAAIDCIFRSETDKFFTIRGMLTKGQWKYLGCVAKEGVLTQPTSGRFINKNNLGTAAASKRCLSSLIEKELIYEDRSGNVPLYSVNNVFLSRWLESRIS